MRDRVVARYRSARDSSAVEPDEGDILEMVADGIREACKKVYSKEQSLGPRWTAISEWKDVEIEKVGKDKLKLKFPTTVIAFTGGNPNDDTDKEGDTPTFEIEIARTDR